MHTHRVERKKVYKEINKIQLKERGGRDETISIKSVGWKLWSAKRNERKSEKKK